MQPRNDQLKFLFFANCHYIYFFASCHYSMTCKLRRELTCSRRHLVICCIIFWISCSFFFLFWIVRKGRSSPRQQSSLDWKIAITSVYFLSSVHPVTKSNPLLPFPSSAAVLTMCQPSSSSELFYKLQQESSLSVNLIMPCVVKCSKCFFLNIYPISKCPPADSLPFPKSASQLRAAPLTRTPLQIV